MIISKIFIPTLLFASILGFSQDQKNFFPNESSLLKKIVPNDKLDFWTLIESNYGKTTELKISGVKKDFVAQSSGFSLGYSNESQFLYIVYSKGGVLNYITKKEDLKPFIGKIDNIEEAAIMQVLDGYQIDYEYKNLAANYHQNSTTYILDLGKTTSKECPLQKTHFTISVDKKTGLVSSIEDNGAYFEVYQKHCKNNPRLLKIKEKHEKENPKDTKPNRRISM